MSDWNNNTNNDVAEGSPFGRFHQSGASALTDRGLELLSMPTLTSRCLGVE